MLKKGANFRDINHIKEMARAGKSAEEISMVLLVHPDTVRKFMGPAVEAPSETHVVDADDTAYVPPDDLGEAVPLHDDLEEL